ncbi:uncharacterized protein YALI1_D03904g [Yarrowia lipolytica]|uniref:Conserved oligomeric Golgi complex subunit 4 n=1 Tax=Yarrowia lipolytica TaxID=4952 RepID=A0A1D8NCZ8_YARLL|nr:hypothetical protein YALI1_D03904g [Yarrowia lipolytica]
MAAYTATNEHELIALVTQIDEDLRSRDSELDAATLNIRRLTRLDNFRANLATLESSQLAFKLGEAAQLGTSISQRVRSRDVEKERLLENHVHVTQTLKLKRDLEAIHRAMDQRSWESAAALVNSCLTEIPSEVIEGGLSRDKVPSGEHPQPPRQQLDEICESLGKLFLREFDKAIQSRDVHELTRYFKLFPLVDRTELGLSTYASFVCSIITEESRKLLQGAPATPPSAFYGLITSRLFENVATIVVQHGKVVDKHYGKGHMLLVIQNIQKEADVQAGIIVDTWFDERRVEKMVEMGDYDDLKHVSDLLAECGMILNRWALYRKFLAGFEGGDKVTEKSMFQQKIDSRVLPVFAELTRAFFQASIQKAVELEVVNEDTHVTSLVEDTMYILKTVLGHIVGTGVESHVSSQLTMLRKVLDSAYISHFQTRIREYAPKQLAGVTAATTQSTLSGLPPSEEKRVKLFCLYINSGGSSCDYVNKIVDHVNLTVYSDKSHVESALSSFSTGVSAKLEDLVAQSVQLLYSNIFSPHLRSLVTVSFRNTVYLASSDDTSSACAYLFNNGWTKLLAGWSDELSFGYDRLVSLMVTSLAKLLEKKIWGLNVNEMGAIALDRDVSKIISHVTSNRYKLRDKFVRVAQLVTLVGLDDEEEEEGIDLLVSTIGYEDDQLPYPSLALFILILEGNPLFPICRLL